MGSLNSSSVGWKVGTFSRSDSPGSGEDGVELLLARSGVGFFGMTVDVGENS